MSMDTITAASVGLVLLLLLWFKRLPSVDSLTDFMAALNTKGGNIFVLFVLSGYFFLTSARMFYYLIHMVIDGKLTADNSYALMGLQFLTTSAFGGAFGAMLTMMTGEAPKAPAGTVQTSTVSTVNATTPATEPPPTAPPISPISSTESIPSDKKETP